MVSCYTCSDGGDTSQPGKVSSAQINSRLTLEIASKASPQSAQSNHFRLIAFGRALTRFDSKRLFGARRVKTATAKACLFALLALFDDDVDDVNVEIN